MSYKPLARIGFFLLVLVTVSLLVPACAREVTVTKTPGPSPTETVIQTVTQTASPATQTVTQTAPPTTQTITSAAPTVTVTATPTPSPTATQPPIKNPDTFVQITVADVETLDPAWAYDTASQEQIFNIYEPLIHYKGESTAEFEPRLATEWQVSADGLEYRFKIRSDVKFHDGNSLTAKDVEYSFERAMVQDRDGGPVWMLLEPLLGVHSTRSGPGQFDVTFEDIDSSVEVESDWVIFKLKNPYPPFMAILAGTWSSIVGREWAVAQGDWPGTAETWQNYANPQVPPLQNRANGTGPFKLERWEPGVEISLARNDTYWRQPAGLKRAITKVISEWTTRKLMFLAGDADWIYVPMSHMAELQGVKDLKVYKSLPGLEATAFFFMFRINPDSPFLGSGKLDGKGIPPDFFSDINVREGFAYSFDWETYLGEALQNEAQQPASPVVQGLPFYNPDQEKYSLDLAKAEEHFKAAWGGDLWENGMELTIIYNIGNTDGKVAADILMWNLAQINDKFNVRVQALPWPSVLQGIMQLQLPMFFASWLADYPDPHNLVFPFMHSQGPFAGLQGYANTEVDELIAKGINTTSTEERQSIYYQLQKIYHDDAINITLHQPLYRQYFRDWVKGWYYNPIYPGRYFYTLSKTY